MHRIGCVRKTYFCKFGNIFIFHNRREGFDDKSMYGCENYGWSLKQYYLRSIQLQHYNNIEFILHKLVDVCSLHKQLPMSFLMTMHHVKRDMQIYAIA